MFIHLLSFCRLRSTNLRQSEDIRTNNHPQVGHHTVDVENFLHMSSFELILR